MTELVAVVLAAVGVVFVIVVVWVTLRAARRK